MSREWWHIQSRQPSKCVMAQDPKQVVLTPRSSRLECIRKDFPEWPLSTVKVWEAEDDTDTLYREVFRVLVDPDKMPTYKCWCRHSRWDTSAHDRHGSEGKYCFGLEEFDKLTTNAVQVSVEDTPSPVLVWKRPRYGNRSHFTSRYRLFGNWEIHVSGSQLWKCSKLQSQHARDEHPS